MTDFERLYAANPHIAIHRVNEAVFKPYGRVLNIDAAKLIYTCREAIEMPYEGIKYFPALKEIDSHSCAESIRDICFGQLDAQMGVCFGHNSTLNALEYHICSEINIAVTDLVLLLAELRDLDEDGRLESGKIKAFYLHEGDVVEIYGPTLHYCPCEVRKTGFSCIVGLPRGTNTSLDRERTKHDLLWAKNKWLIVHEENSAFLARGARAGINGTNLKIHAIDELL